MSITQRIDAITLVKQDRFKEVLPAPKSVKIELTGRCNYRCGFCALRTRKDVAGTPCEECVAYA